VDNLFNSTNEGVHLKLEKLNSGFQINVRGDMFLKCLGAIEKAQYSDAGSFNQGSPMFYNEAAEEIFRCEFFVVQVAGDGDKGGESGEVSTD